MKKAGIYDPYLDTLGGGERYSLTVAECLAQSGWQVNVFWDDHRIRLKIKKKFGLKLEKINFVPDIFKQSRFRKHKVLRKYDLIFFLSDGSIPLLSSKKSILHFQVPFHGVRGGRWLNRLKLKKINAVVCNSKFAKGFIDQEYGLESQVIYPPIAVREFKLAKKERIILSVGRFSRLMQAKRQDILVDGFKEMLKTDRSGRLEGWKLVLVGGTEVGKDASLGRLKRMARGWPIEIMENPSFGEIKKLYAKAKIFWTASGFGINENKEPEKVEHFGITTVEAMAAGCVPVVINKGGQPEIVSEDKDGLLWVSKKELIDKTLRLIKNQKLWEKLSKAAQKRAQDFSQERFCREIKEIIG